MNRVGNSLRLGLRDVEAGLDETVADRELVLAWKLRDTLHRPGRVKGM
jgi:hypothetical protein